MAGRLAEWVTGGRLSEFLKCEVWRGLRITWAGRVCRYRDWTQMPVTVREMPAGRSAASGCLGALPGSNRAWDPGRTVRTSLLALTTSTVWLRTFATSCRQRWADSLTQAYSRSQTHTGNWARTLFICDSDWDMDPNSGFAGPLGRDRWKEKEIRLRGNM